MQRAATSTLQVKLVGACSERAATSTLVRRRRVDIGVVGHVEERHVNVTEDGAQRPLVRVAPIAVKLQVVSAPIAGKLQVAQPPTLIAFHFSFRSFLANSEVQSLDLPALRLRFIPSSNPARGGSSGANFRPRQQQFDLVFLSFSGGSSGGLTTSFSVLPPASVFE
nr:hypothetical protein Iba_scaffold44564CG0020 [Ipomoea batatas]GME09059.1 hypothetical protein Iba_scaffold8117CG0080 [Ipomoea batatas]